jgi:FtsP/CotA-like multicopper oxidase with cupredoxin domain
MGKRKTWFFLILILLVAALVLPASPVMAADPLDIEELDLHYKGEVTPEEREAAADRFKAAYRAATQPGFGIQGLVPDAVAGAEDMHIMGEDGLLVPHYFGPFPNYGLSPLPTLDENGDVVPGTGMRKFVDSLPGLGPEAANNLGQYLPVAVADEESYPGSDYYEIAVVEYKEQMHSDLPPTTLRGYVQISTDVVPGAEIQLLYPDGTPIFKSNGQPALAVDDPHYLGPVIIAKKDRPVRVKFYNLLPTGEDGDLFIPVDTTVMGAGMGPVMDMVTNEPVNYTQNRATLHLHGGRTPWISDGTPHQWITPANEDTPYPQGVSVYPVPDMDDDNDPTDGEMTFYYTNKQSARLMFYHDHSWGITRLNVYAGEAAGYLLVDDVEQDLIDRGLIPEDQIPLIIQDKTFVPDPGIPFSTTDFGTYESQMAFYDPTWDYDRWGGFGSLWYPHVYMPVQNPFDVSGVNAFGRWHYGPWFWPPTNNIEYLPVPNPYADPGNPGYSPLEPPFIPGTPNNSTGMESFFDTPVVNGTAYPYLEVDPKSYRLRILNAANDRFWNLQLHVADPEVYVDGVGLTEVRMVPADSSSGLPENWPTDGRAGGVPDPALVGPPMIQIGNEAGFLPEPVVLENQPIVWKTDPTLFTVGNVESGNLILAPAERADVIVDFSDYAGQTLILYNDAPAPFPALAPQYDYYTGAPDMTDTGSSPGTQPGYGPNTRTIMQIRVADKTPAEPFALDALIDEFVPGDGAGVFVRAQEEIIVGQSAYNSIYNSEFPDTWPYWGISGIQDNKISFKTVSGETVDNFYMEPKAIQDEMGEAFDEYGRMSGFLGLEIPFTAAGIQNFVLLGFTAPPVDLVPIGSGSDGTQIWKITHNGVDTHPIHFHMFEVQLLNRVGWDGMIMLPDANERGWKETVRVSPLEDTIIALRPIIHDIPFELPNSVRLIDPSQPEGVILKNSTLAEANGLAPLAFAPNGEPIDIFNHYVNFGWEYVWHCHILSHEEMDMMHVAMIALPPLPPSGLGFEMVGTSVTLSWLDNSINETDWKIQRSIDSGPWETVAVIPSETSQTKGSTISYIDTAIYAGNYSYQVLASNVVGDTWDYSDPNLNEGASFPFVSMDSLPSDTVELGEIIPDYITVVLNGITADKPLVLDMNGIVQEDVTLTGDGFTFNVAQGDILLGSTGLPLNHITVTQASNLPAPDAGSVPVKAWNFVPDGATFNPAMSMTITYNPAQFPAGVQEQSLTFVYWDGTAWTQVNGQTLDMDANTITVPVEHFTIYAVMGTASGIILDTGWNTFSTPVRLHTSVDNWGELAAANNLDFSAAYKWTGNGFEWVNPADTITPLNAIYINMNNAGSVGIVPFSGISAPPSKSLTRGWNLIGSAFMSPSMPVDEALATAYFGEGNVWGYSQVVSPSGVNQADWAYVRDGAAVPLMEIGKGYWVFMTNPATLAGFTTTP